MRVPPQVRWLPDGRRLHLQHGPIDLIIGVDGTPGAVRAALQAASDRFRTVLDELCAELDGLRRPATPKGTRLRGRVARRMHDAVAPFAGERFVTPMAAVAGAVAEEILGSMTDAAAIDRAFVNNGGDIALHLAPGQRWRIGMVDRPDRPSLIGGVTIEAGDPVRGIATSGWRGRSFSLGIADAVTVLARSAAVADAAATVIANAVDLPGHPAIRREPADEVQPDSDLGARLVTREVGPLGAADIRSALRLGRAAASALIERGLAEAAVLHLQGVTDRVGTQRPVPARVSPSALVLPVLEHSAYA